MKIVSIQAPFVQLNAPYPAVAYLHAFAKSLGHESNTIDLSIETIRSIFSYTGLTKIFSKAESLLLKEAKKHDGSTLSEEEKKQLFRYFSNKQLWLQSVEPLVSYLSGTNPDFENAIQTFSLPWGFRFESLLETKGDPVILEDPLLCATSLFLDLSDFVQFSYDSSFSLARYADHLSASQSSFSVIENSFKTSEIFSVFLQEILENKKQNLLGTDLFCISVPFPGSLSGALFTANELKRLVPNAKIALGGGYVNTELRNIKDSSIFSYIDYLCFDSGFGSLLSIIKSIEHNSTDLLYKTIKGDSKNPKNLIAHGMNERDNSFYKEQANYSIILPPNFTTLTKEEAVYKATIFPDFSETDFSSYIRIKENQNPMHALWSNTKWIKAYLAYGCYYKNCLFCDTSLDYINDYRPVQVQDFYNSMQKALSFSHSNYLHLVDEAAPVSKLIEFALLNLKSTKPFIYWGNIRFEKAFSLDTCRLLKASGMIAVSGGIEVASDEGVSLVNKGLTLSGIIRTLYNFHEAGIMTHGYLMYGLSGQTKDDIMLSANFISAFFKAEILTSAFWHTFTLTRHSKLFTEIESGKRTDISPIIKKWEFATNDLDFIDSKKFESFNEPLDRALSEWMNGINTGIHAEYYIKGKTTNQNPCNKIVKDAIKKIEDEAYNYENAKRTLWIAGTPILQEQGSKSRLYFSFQNTLFSIKSESDKLQELKDLLMVSDPKEKETNNGSNKNTYLSPTDFLKTFNKIFPDQEKRTTILETLRSTGLLFV